MKTVQCYVSCPPGMQKVGGIKFFFARKLYLPPLKPWCCPCQGETVKVKFVYNQLMGEKEGDGQIKSRTISKKARAASDSHQECFNVLQWS